MTEEDSASPQNVKIGELLLSVGALTSGDLTEAIQIAKRMGVPIGRVLVMSGCVSESNLQMTLECQSLVRDGLLDLETGTKALNKVFHDKVTLKDALHKLNWAPRQDANSNKLGELLIDSNIVTRGQLDRALETSFQSGMPLGGTLVLQGIISAQLLPTILHAQEQIRDNKMSREQAIDSLQQALIFWARADDSKKEHLAGGYRRSTESGGLFSSAKSSDSYQGLTSRPVTTHAVDKPLPRSASGAHPAVPSYPDQEQIVAASNGASSVHPAAAARAPQQQQQGAQNTSFSGAHPAVPASPAQQSNASGAHTAVPVRPSQQRPQDTGHKIKPPKNFVQSVDPSAVAKASLPSPPQTGLRQPGSQAQAQATDIVSLVELLKLSGYCTSVQLDQAIAHSLQDSRLAAKLLLAIGFIDSGWLNNFVYCQALIAKGTLRTDQALYVLNSMRHKGITIEQALAEMGIPETELP